MAAIVARLGWLLWLCASAVSAHTRSESYSTWEIVGSTVHVAVTIPKAEAARLAAGGGGPTDEEVASYLARHVSVTSEGKACPSAGAPRAGAATEELRRVEFTFRCVDSNAMVLHSSAFFELVPSHVTYARIRKDDGKFIEQLITDDHRDLEVSGANDDHKLQDASFFEYTRLGIMHILTGPDHLAFV
ncbi:MAG: HupE/UreJ family protein, partial [Pseudomonadota bacterium]|nr:HupE/UreJ family protein [Pseudomonadota bacterium]